MMTEATETPPTEPESLRKAIEIFRVYVGLVLLCMAKHGEGLRDTVARNFNARGMASTESICMVWTVGSEQDAWILHRSLIDRLLHLRHLAETDSFNEFEEYSFLSMYEARHQLLSDSQMQGRVPQGLRELQKGDRPRYEVLSAKEGRWRRPRAEEVANQMGLGFLYRFGYDYASTHVHPMVGDGAIDFTRLISAPQLGIVPDATVVRNSILIQSMLVQEAFNASRLRWRVIAYEFLEDMRRFAGTGDRRFQQTFLKIGKAQPEFQLCDRATSGAGA